MCQTENKKAAAVKFLENDFNQAYEQLRYYDEKILSVCKFMTTIYSGVIALVVGCYKLSLDKGVDMSWACIGLLVPTFIFGLLFFVNLMKCRIYSVMNARYLNEQRHLFLTDKPLGFENKTKMFTDYKKPLFFNMLSSQIFFIYAVSLFNGVLLCLLFYFLVKEINLIIIGISFLSILVQILVSVAYLKGQETQVIT